MLRKRSEKSNNSSRIKESNKNEEKHFGLRKHSKVKYFQSDSEEEDEIIENSPSENDDEDSDFDIKEYIADKRAKKQKQTEADKPARKKKQTESLSEYEKQLQEKRAEKLNLLASLGVMEAKNELYGSLKQRKKTQKRKPVIRNYNPDEVPVRVSGRQKKSINYSENKKDREVESLQEFWGENKKYEAKTLTFKELLYHEYEYFMEDFKEIVEPVACVEPSPLLYDKENLKCLSKKFNLRLGSNGAVTAMAWHPSVENLVLVSGSEYGKLDFWNIRESDFDHYVFAVHSIQAVSHLQFNPYNNFQLVSSSRDGTLFSCDIKKQVFDEVLSTSNENLKEIKCTYFDFFSPTSYLVSLTNGEVIIIDQRERSVGENQLKRHICHDSVINTVHMHPVNERYFVTAGADKKICIWDLRRLSKYSAIQCTNYEKSVQCAFFSPVTGKFLLTKSYDELRMFDCTGITYKNLQWEKTVKYRNTERNRRARPVWLPNSDDTFACYFQDLFLKGSLNVFDTDFNIYEKIQDGLEVAREDYLFHPFRPALASRSQVLSVSL